MTTRLTSEHAREVRMQMAFMVSGPPDNGMSHRRALDALEQLEQELASWKRVAREYEHALAERGLL